MINKNKDGGFDITCDSCSESWLEVESSDFNDVVAAIRQAGWTSEKQPNGEWEHYCDVCL